MWVNGQHHTLVALHDNWIDNMFDLGKQGMLLERMDVINGQLALKITAPNPKWTPAVLNADVPAFSPLDAKKSNPILPSDQFRHSLTGKWNTSLGVLDLVQSGKNQVLGTLKFSAANGKPGGTGWVNGTLKGNSLDVFVSVSGGLMDFGHALFEPDGKSGLGVYLESNLTRHDPWTLKR